MKLHNHIAALLTATAFAVGSVSCTDLDEKTFDRIDASAYYQDENSVKGAVAAIYSSAENSFLEYFWYLNEFSADQVAWRTWNGGAWGWDEGAKFVLSSQSWNSENEINRSAWENAWQTIGLCNTIIDDLSHIDPASIGMTDASLSSYIAEVRTMRAYVYYNNFEVWGGAIPLNTSVGGEVPGSADPDFDKGCEVVWNFIVDELDGCYADLPAEQGNNATRTRMNQGMNRMLKMRLLLNSELWTGTPRYTECAKLCEEIINGDYGSYNLADDYRQIYSIGNDACQELVFAFAMWGGHTFTNNRTTPFLPLQYQELFDYPVVQTGWNCCCIVPSKDNTGTDYIMAGNKICGTRDGKSFIFDYGDKLGAPLDRMNDKDIRKQPYVSDAAGNWQGLFLMGDQKDYVSGQPYLADADLQDLPLIYVDQCGTFTNAGRDLEPVMSPRWGMTNTGYRMMRYPITPESAGVDYRDIAEVEFRLSEVYYTLAECRMRAGDANAAKELVNEVRQRYFNASDASEIDKPGPGFNAFDMDWMLSEWGLEFLNEGNRRRTDLRRFDKFTQGQWWFFGRATETDRELPAKRDRKYEWFPLPEVALMVNPGLVQNPNY
ncbi:MAG: RagB/SusD family nutrient uptake outer membrane protein [Muribaculaceae bacterium]|nr:RagB/SusD family nutrient uptake outer membrane protein [Muribaculaceae bacterium]MDE6854953.1 RagB/SusD family nutrient uptake outer membrane protein [Muribaculaceae bacterium]